MGEAGTPASRMPSGVQPPAHTSRYAYSASLGSIILCLGLWIRAKTIGEDERGNAERRAIFVGLWPPMLWLIGDTLHRSEGRGGRSRFSRSARASRWARRALP